jgi:hypothetical protein
MRRLWPILLWTLLLSAPVWSVYGVCAFVTLDPFWFNESADIRIGWLMVTGGVYILGVIVAGVCL